MPRVSGCLFLGLALVVTACGLFEKKKPEGDASPGNSAPPPRASVSPVFTYPRRSVLEGKAPGGAWVGTFTIERRKGGEGRDLKSATKFCHDQGRSLCTETQWQRACASDGKLGRIETWTVSMEGKQAVVRGGEGCQARALSAPGKTTPQRGAVCCERAVAISTTDDSKAFLRSHARRLLDYERAARRSAASRLKSLLDDPVVFGGKQRKPDEVTQSFEKRSPDAWSVLDSCDVRVKPVGSEKQLVSDCQVVHFDGDRFSGQTIRIVHGGPKSKIQLIGKERDMALLGNEKKERVRSFLGGD